MTQTDETEHKDPDLNDPIFVAELRDAIIDGLEHLQGHLTAVIEGTKRLFDRYGSEPTVIEFVSTDMMLVKDGCEMPLAMAEGNIEALLEMDDPVAEIEKAARGAEAIQGLLENLMGALFNGEVDEGSDKPAD